MEQNTANIITPWEVNLKIMIMKKIPNSVEYLETVFIYQNQVTANQIISSN